MSLLCEFPVDPTISQWVPTACLPYATALAVTFHTDLLRQLAWLLGDVIVLVGSFSVRDVGQQILQGYPGQILIAVPNTFALTKDTNDNS